jgi:hypothetical protein
MKVTNASVAFSRSKPVEPFVASFEDGALDQFVTWGHTTSVTSNQAREGTKAMQVDVDSTSWCQCDEGQDPSKEIRRAEISPPNGRAAGGHYGEDRWYGFSVYFPETFKVPQAEAPFVGGTWNIFAQWHALYNDGLDCTQEAGGVAIAFNARYWKANGYRNPGQSETATPVSGDYLEVEFEGGQLLDLEGKACHETAEGTVRYVIAPLHRGQWYDFVLHTRWTPEKGGPDNSVSEVWMNGKQVLGNDSVPVSTPTLLWHGSPGVHSNNVTLQTGLYRGPSAEDPTTRLFLDSYRAGNSYGQVAPEVHSPRIDAESYSATLKGGGLPELSTNLGAFKCAGAALEGTATNAASQLNLAAKYGECEITSGGTRYVASVKMNGCHYVLGVKNAGPPYKGTWGVACEKEGEAIEFKHRRSLQGGNDADRKQLESRTDRRVLDRR